MQTMMAAVLNAAPGGLAIEQLPVPEPHANEVLVKVHACGVCHTDLHVMKAEVAFPTPAVMGHEITGTVAALGPGVAGPPVGSRVVCAFVMPCGFCRACATGRDDLCDNFFGLNRLKGHAVRRHHAAAPPGRHARGDVLDGRPGRVRRGAGHRRVRAAGLAALRRVGGAGVRHLHRLRRGAARGRPARRRARGGRGRGRRRACRSSRSPRRSARRRSSRWTSATRSWTPRGGSAPPTS